MSDTIVLRKALLQGDSLCPKLFTIHLNPLAWTLRTTDGYTLSKPIDHKITQLLFIDDMKIVVPNEKKLCPTLKVEKRASKDLSEPRLGPIQVCCHEC